MSDRGPFHFAQMGAEGGIQRRLCRTVGKAVARRQRRLREGIFARTEGKIGGLVFVQRSDGRSVDGVQVKVILHRAIDLPHRSDLRVGYDPSRNAEVEQPIRSQSQGEHCAGGGVRLADAAQDQPEVVAECAPFPHALAV